MQKVVKDILTDTRKKIHDAPKFTKERTEFLRDHKALATDFDALKDLIYLRESIEIKSIVNKLKKLVLEKEKKFFDVWMAYLNDDIQDLA